MNPWLQGLAGGIGGALVAIGAFVLLRDARIIDLPAWVQAVGSVGAIIGAIAIDRGSARRVLEQREREAEEREANRLEALMQSQRLVEEVQQAANGDALDLMLEAERIGLAVRRLDRAARLLDAYLKTEGPPHTMAALMAAHDALQLLLTRMGRTRSEFPNRLNERRSELHNAKVSIAAALVDQQAGRF